MSLINEALRSRKSLIPSFPFRIGRTCRAAEGSFALGRRMRRSQVRFLFPAPDTAESPGLGRGFLFVGKAVGNAGRWPAASVVPAHGWEAQMASTTLYSPKRHFWFRWCLDPGARSKLV